MKRGALTLSKWREERIQVSAGWAGCAQLLLGKAWRALCACAVSARGEVQGNSTTRISATSYFQKCLPEGIDAPCAFSFPFCPKTGDKNMLWLLFLSCGHTATHHGCWGFHGPRECWWHHCWSHGDADVHADYTKAAPSIVLPAHGTFFRNICKRDILLFPKTDAISFQYGSLSQGRKQRLI